MTDELVKRLRAVDHMSLEDCFCQSSLYDQAADRIEQLTEERDRLREALTALHKQALMLRGEQAYREFARAVEKQSRDALKGESHE